MQRGMRHAEVEEFPLSDTPEGGFRLDLDRLALRLVGARAFFMNSPQQPHRLDRYRRRDARHPCPLPRHRLLADR